MLCLDINVTATVRVLTDPGNKGLRPNRIAMQDPGRALTLRALGGVRGVTGQRAGIRWHPWVISRTRRGAVGVITTLATT
jgi:hypothetical protein